MFDLRRLKILKDKPHTTGCVVYNMSREQRVADNWALIYAQQQAMDKKVPLYVIFTVFDDYCNGAQRSYDFMFDGLSEVQHGLAKLNISLTIIHTTKTAEAIDNFCKEVNAGLLVLDMSPIRDSNTWEKDFLSNTNIRTLKVDARNIVPVWIASEKQEFAARTIRPKINSKLSEFLTDFPKMKTHIHNNANIVSAALENTNWESIKRDVKSKKHINSFEGMVWQAGEAAAKKTLKSFLEKKLNKYEEGRNDANADGQSNMSPYLMFGQISRQRIALDVLAKHSAGDANVDAFLEELIVRAELSENYCYYNTNYDNFNGLANWAQATLNKARTDKREYIYTLEQFEKAETHDELWNAAQKEMLQTGKMHGYMRMYWAKKILEWSESPEEAIRIAVYLNDVYELDGRCPNGYCGVMWSIGGLHDRVWFPRPVFGNIRYMARSGCEKKFKVKEYIEKFKFSKLL